MDRLVSVDAIGIGEEEINNLTHRTEINDNL